MLVQDVRHALRALRRAPAFTIGALLTLALGIGATTAIFSVVNAALLQPPPYPEPHRLFVLTTDDGSSQAGTIFHYVRERVRSFERVAARGGGTGWNFVAGRRAEYVTSLPVSHEYFDVLGVRPLIGRGFTEVEDQPKGPRAAVITETLWRRLLDARPEAIGEVIQLGGVAHTLVGVMPASFQSWPAVDLWTPLQLSPTDNSWNYTIVGRLRGDVPEAQATRELEEIRAGLQRDVPNVSEGRARSTIWMPYQRWQGLAVRENLLLLFGAVAFLLVIACVNVAGLQLVRAVARRGEIATRAALGSGRGRTVRLVLTESVLLSLGGAALGLIAAQWGTQALVGVVPEGLLGGRAVALDWRVLALTLAIGVGSGIVFGVTPALGASRVDVRSTLWDGGRHTAGRATLWLRRSFMVAEIALAVVLLVGAGLLIRTFVNLGRVDTGFDPRAVVVGRMSLQGTPFAADTPGALAAFYEQSLVRMRSLPGVSAAAAGNDIPIERGLNLAVAPPSGGLVDEVRSIDWRYVTPDYFAVFRIPVRAGRSFDARDRADAAPVAIVNEAFARTYFGRPDVVGESLRVAMAGEPLRQIVGVVGDVKSRSGSGWTAGANALAAPVAPAMYVPAAQVAPDLLRLVHRYFPISWAVRTRDGSPVAVTAIQQIVASSAPQLPFIRFETMEEVVARDIEIERFLMTLLTVFASVAMALAATGMYGLTAYAVGQRTKEVGIRMAIGATGGRVLVSFVAEGISLAVVGLLIGTGAAMLFGRLLASIVFNVTPHDPITFLTVGAVLLAVTGLAVLVPSIRASRTNLVRALRLD